MPQDVSLIFLIYREILLACSCGIILLGLDDLAVFVVWLCCVSKRDRSLSEFDPVTPVPLAIFIAAWDESAVIGRMLRSSLHRLDYPDYTIFVGCYPNDPATLHAVAEVVATDSRVRMVSGEFPGPTSKAECLNRCWQSLMSEERRLSAPFAAVILHDAEDVMHRDELWVFAGHIATCDMVQIPVKPLIDPQSRWVAGHYADEFAEAHGQDLLMRQHLGAAVPSAGVGCAIGRNALAAIATRRGNLPFDQDSLTEDYELGLRLGEMGRQTRFVRMRSRDGCDLVATRAYFPSTLSTSIRQKSRWVLGIAVAGWDRLGWHGSLAERWMRLRDRRALLSGAVLLLAYVALPISVVLPLLAEIGWVTLAPLSGLQHQLLAIGMGLLIWRLAMR
jgi:adsorption protein B